MKNVTITILALALAACGKTTETVFVATKAPVVAPAATPVSSSPCSIKSDKNLLIIGDSISMGYTGYVQRDLCGLYNVTRVQSGGSDQNAQGTTFTLANLNRWLNEAGPEDVVVWNNGLWNARDTQDPQAPGNATDLPTYQSELVQIATILKATGARVIFMTTTDIPSDESLDCPGTAFIPGRDLSENAIAESVLPGMGVEVYDLHALAIQNVKLHLSNDRIHFDAQGYSLFAEFISDMIRANYEMSN